MQIVHSIWIKQRCGACEYSAFTPKEFPNVQHNFFASIRTSYTNWKVFLRSSALILAAYTHTHTRARTPQKCIYSSYMQLWSFDICYIYIYLLLFSVLFYSIFRSLRFLNLLETIFSLLFFDSCGWYGVAYKILRKIEEKECARENERKINENRFSDVGYTAIRMLFSIHFGIFRSPKDEHRAWIAFGARASAPRWYARTVHCAAFAFKVQLNGSQGIFHFGSANDYVTISESRNPSRRRHFCDRKRPMNWRAVHVGEMCGHSSWVALAFVCVCVEYE